MKTILTKYINIISNENLIRNQLQTKENKHENFYFLL